MMNGRSLETMNPPTRTMPGRSTSGFHRPGWEAGRAGYRERDRVAHPVVSCLL